MDASEGKFPKCIDPLLPHLINSCSSAPHLSHSCHFSDPPIDIDQFYNPTNAEDYVPFTLQRAHTLVTDENGGVIEEKKECTETRYMPLQYACAESIERILHELNNNTSPSPTQGYMYWEHVCTTCQRNPCYILENLPYLHSVATHLKATGQSNRSIRYQLYRRLSNKIHGPLGRGVRKELPPCLVEFIRENFPNEDKTEPYVGFRANSDDSE